MRGGRGGAGVFVSWLVDKVRVKGKQIPLRIYLPLAPDTPTVLLANYQQLEQALAAYFQQDFATAQQQLQALQRQVIPEQTALVRLLELYQQRTAAFLQQGPGPDWDGCYTHTQK